MAELSRYETDEELNRIKKQLFLRAMAPDAFSLDQPVPASIIEETRAIYEEIGINPSKFAELLLLLDKGETDEVSIEIGTLTLVVWKEGAAYRWK